MTNEQKIMQKAKKRVVYLNDDLIIAMCRVIEAARRFEYPDVLDNEELVFCFKQFDVLRVE